MWVSARLTELKLACLHNEAGKIFLYATSDCVPHVFLSITKLISYQAGHRALAVKRCKSFHNILQNLMFAQMTIFMIKVALHCSRLLYGQTQCGHFTPSSGENAHMA